MGDADSSVVWLPLLTQEKWSREVLATISPQTDQEQRKLVSCMKQEKRQSGTEDPGVPRSPILRLSMTRMSETLGDHLLCL